MSNQILINAISNFDFIKEKSNKYEIKHDYKKNINSTTYDKIIIDNSFGSNKEAIKSTDIEIDLIGIHDTIDKVWSWGYLYEKSNIVKLFNYAIGLPNNSDINNNIIRSTLLNSKFIISDLIQLQIILAISTYLFKSDYIISDNSNIINNKTHLIKFYSIKYKNK